MFKFTIFLLSLNIAQRFLFTWKIYKLTSNLLSLYLRLYDGKVELFTFVFIATYYELL